MINLMNNINSFKEILEDECKNASERCGSDAGSGGGLSDGAYGRCRDDSENEGKI